MGVPTGEVPLVGRAAELASIRAAIERAAAGEGSTLLLAGEPGIGKSRLAAEALELAARHGFVRLAGAAFPLHGELAYAPVLDALGPYLTGLDPARQARLVADLPDLGRLFAGLRMPPPEPLGDAALERTRLFEAVARLLHRMAELDPVALLLDDLHWADSASLELVHYLGRGLAGRRILLLGTYRAAEERDRPELPVLTHSLERLGLAERLPVTGLPPDGVAALAAVLLGGEPPAELLALLQARTAGTPLFVTAVVRSLLDAGALVRRGDVWVLGDEGPAAVPPIVRDLVLGRLDRLAPAERALLELVAVAADAAAVPVLEHAGGLSADGLAAAARTLRDRGLLVEETGGPHPTYRVTHPLIAEVIDAELPEASRRRLHTALAAALEALRPDDLERLAHHYRGAGFAADPGRALEVLVAAGERATEVHADGEAAGHLTAAVALARVHRPDRLADLLEQLGEARSRASRLGAAVQAWREAVEVRGRAGDAVGEARARTRLALAEWDRGGFEAAAAHLDAGLRALSGPAGGAGGADATGVAELIELRYARLLMVSRAVDVAGVEREAAALLELAQRSGSTAAAVTANFARGDALYLGGRSLAARELCMTALAGAEQGGQWLLAARIHRHLAMIALGLGEIDRAREHLAVDLAWAERAAVPTLELGPKMCLGLADVVAGAWPQAQRAADEIMATAHRAGAPRGVAAALVLRAYLLAEAGRTREARAHLAEARTVYAAGVRADRHVFGVSEFVEAVTALADGDPARARAVAEQAVPAVSNLPCFNLTALGEAQVGDGDPAAALATADRLAAIGPGGAWPLACAARVEGLARAALGERDAALELLARAATALTELGMRYQAARALLDWAQTAAGGAAPSGTEVSTAVHRALAVFDDLDARPPADQARRLLRRLGEQPPAARRRRGDAALSDRELEVVKLVADGLSNAEIAGRLYISPRTVTTHLQHVYARLGIGSRTALARWVLDRGLAGG